MPGEDLLVQIEDLLSQYLALGGDTPVAPEAQALLASIQQAGGGAMGATPGDQPMAPGASQPEVPQGPDMGTFEGATQAAQQDMKDNGAYGRKKKQPTGSRP